MCIFVSINSWYAFLSITELHASSAGLFIRELPRGYSYGDYIQDLEAEEEFQNSVENKVLQFENAYDKSQMTSLIIFAKQQTKDEHLYKVSMYSFTLMYNYNEMTNEYLLLMSCGKRTT